MNKCLFLVCIVMFLCIFVFVVCVGFGFIDIVFFKLDMVMMFEGLFFNVDFLCMVELGMIKG